MFVVFYKKLKNVSYEHDRLNGCTKPWAKRMAENTRFAGVCVGAGAVRSDSAWAVSYWYVTTSRATGLSSSAEPPGSRLFIKCWKTSAVSTTVWMIETRLCKLRGTSDVRWTCLFYISVIIWFLWTKPTIWLLILISTKEWFARVPCFILMKDTGRWLPWMLPGATGRFPLTILCTGTI